MEGMKISKLRERLSDGCIAEFYTQDGYFLKVRPALNIDMVKFSFVKKGTNGENSVDIYVNTDSFDILCDDIISHRLEKLISEQKGNFPTTWVYNTGVNGCKTLALGKGSSQPIVFQGKEVVYASSQEEEGSSKTKVNAFVGVANYSELVVMAKWWKRCCTKYYEDNSAILSEGMAKNSSYFDNYEEETSSTVIENSKKPAAPEPQKTPSPSPKKEEKPQQNDVALVTGNAREYTLIPRGSLEKAENFTNEKPSFVLNCFCKELAKEIEVCFLSAPIGKEADNFNLLKDRLENGWTGTFRIEGQTSTYKGADQLRFTSFVKKG